MDRTDLEYLLGKIGMACFVDYFHEFGNPHISNQDVIDLLPHEYTFKSRTSRTSKARRIFREGSERAALSIIANSDRVEPRAGQKARALLVDLNQRAVQQIVGREQRVRLSQLA